MAEQGIQDLWCRYLDEEPVSAEEDAVLLGALQDDAALGDELLNDEEMDGLLRALARTEEDAEAFVLAVAKRLAAERDSAQFEEGVKQRLHEPDADGEGALAMPRRQARWSLAWALAAAALAVAGVWWVSDQLSVISDQSRVGAVVARVVDKVESGKWKVEGGTWADLKVGDEVREGMRIETGEGGRVKLAYVGEQTSLELSAHSTLGIRHSTLAFLELGRLVATVAKQEAGKAFVVQTPHAEMTVVGTKFSVAALEGRTRLMVEEGTVKMRPADAAEAQDVGSGAVAVARKGEKELIHPGKIRKVVDVKTWGLGLVQGVAFDGKRLWFYMFESATLVAMDPDTTNIVKRVKVEQPFPENAWGASGLAWDGTLLWGWGAPGVMRGVDPETGKTVRELSLPRFDRNPAFDIRDGDLYINMLAWPDRSVLKVDWRSGETLSQTLIKSPLLKVKSVDSMCCSSDMVFITVRRAGSMVVACSDDGQLLYQYDVKAGSTGFFGGDIAYDPQRGLWCGLGKTRVLLVEAE